MPRIIAAALLWAIGIGMACSALAQAPNPPANADPAAALRRMDELLSLWEKQSATITTLDAKFTRVDESPGWRQKTAYVGRAILKSPNLAFLDFQEVSLPDRKLVPYEQIRCTGDAVYLYRSKENQIHIYPLPKQERQRALEEGPLPFLFNMRAQRAKERYHMILIAEDLKYYYVRIEPRFEIDQQEFIRADVYLNKQNFLPDTVRLYAPNGKETKTFRFTGEGTFIHANAPVNEKNFEGRKLKGWDAVYHTEDEVQPQGAVGAQVPGARRAPVGRAGGQAIPRR